MSAGRVALPFELPLDVATIDKLTITACGTAYMAGLTSKYWFERFARIPVTIEVASEFRYGEVPMGPPGGLTLVVSQSGETADTLASLRYAKANGPEDPVRIVNVPTSTMARESDVTALTLAGPEIGVASTKAFTCQLAVLACLALAIGRARGTLSAADEARLVGDLIAVPGLMAEAIKHEGQVEHLARELGKVRDVLYLGRGTSFPLAMEGALKLKELSYIHAEGYAAGELKHGPIALDRRGHAGHRHRPARRGLREDGLQHAGGLRAGRAADPDRRQPRGGGFRHRGGGDDRAARHGARVSPRSSMRSRCR